MKLKTFFSQSKILNSALSNVFSPSVFSAVFTLTFLPLAHAEMGVSRFLKNDIQFLQTRMSADQCESYIKSSNKYLDRLSANSLQKYKNPQLGSQLIQLSFQDRLALKSALERMETETQGQVPAGCVQAIRLKINSNRLFEEYIARVASLNEDTDVLTGKAPYLLVNPKYPKFELQSGDILISRGNAVVSAMIAQIGDQPALFSHAAFVYIEPSTGNRYIIEAHIEIGSDVDLFENNYGIDGKLRSIVYRPKDQKWAKAAAEIAFQRVKNSLEEKKPIKYDFSMNLDQAEDLFCSEIPYMAYKEASAGTFILGDKYSTSFVGKKNGQFLKNIGITKPYTFAPSDVELDSKLDLVAEWRDLGRVYKTHRNDAIVSKIYSLMETQGMNLDISQKKYDAKFLLFLRNSTPLKKFLEKSLAPNISTSALSTMMIMDEVGSKLLDLVYEEQTKLETTLKRALTYYEVQAVVERVYNAEKLRNDFALKNSFSHLNPDSSDPEPSSLQYFQFPDKK